MQGEIALKQTFKDIFFNLIEMCLGTTQFKVHFHYSKFMCM